MTYSLREAARASGRSEESIRRAILTGELAAEAVADDRQYLIRGEDLGLTPPAPAPAASSPRGRRVCLAAAAAGFAFLLLAVAIPYTSVIRWRCQNCASTRRFVEFRDGSHRVTLFRWTATDEVTAIIQGAYPEECSHEWFMEGILTSDPARAKLSAWLSRNLEGFRGLKERGILEAARKVDPRGAADLARWALQHSGLDGPAEPVRFPTAAEFQRWFAELRARVEWP